MLQRNLFSVVASFGLICARQNHSRNTVLQNRFMKVNSESFRELISNPIGMSNNFM